MYTATITKKVISNGKLAVTVSFQNGTGDSFEDTYETTQHQKGGWIVEQIHRRLKDVNSLPKLGEQITLGPVHPELPHDPQREQYLAKATQYTQYMEIARLGIIPSDRSIIITLRNWLRVNFKDEYVDLF